MAAGVALRNITCLQQRDREGNREEACDVLTSKPPPLFYPQLALLLLTV